MSKEITVEHVEKPNRKERKKEKQLQKKNRMEFMYSKNYISKLKLVGLLSILTGIVMYAFTMMSVIASVEIIPMTESVPLVFLFIVTGSIMIRSEIKDTWSLTGKFLFMYGFINGVGPFLFNTLLPFLAMPIGFSGYSLFIDWYYGIGILVVSFVLMIFSRRYYFKKIETMK